MIFKSTVIWKIMQAFEIELKVSIGFQTLNYPQWLFCPISDLRFFIQPSYPPSRASPSSFAMWGTAFLVERLNPSHYMRYCGPWWGNSLGVCSVGWSSNRSITVPYKYMPQAGFESGSEQDGCLWRLPSYRSNHSATIASLIAKFIWHSFSSRVFHYKSSSRKANFVIVESQPVN